MTKHQAAVITAYTGFLLGDFSDFHDYAETLMKRPIFTHEFGDSVFTRELHQASKPDFVSLEIEKGSGNE